MKMHALKSTVVRGYGYDPESRTLKIRFSSGGTYTYAEVPAEIAHGIGAAKSAGAYLAAHIRGKFEHVKRVR